ncbi:unnamed protein product [Hermetia illucens]|uniref:Uncharacterized protein n=1 Tax=Hermetia illucens TaxID=343691 RepID=A0A7R8UF94_HERIL|nr:uncharacterized protein LOC119657810 [Hermetia illucens]CAD7079742.1 unnamed protein product [Hermetia illucens]
MQVSQNTPIVKCGNDYSQRLDELGPWPPKEDNSYLSGGAGEMQRNSNVKAPAKILDNVLDISSTIAKILTICGVDQRKANQAVSSITNSFLNFDEKAQGNPGLIACKTRHLRKDELLTNLKNDCYMTDAEAKLTATVVKCAFRAFYHKQSLRKYNPGYYSQADWQAAAQRTIIAYSKAGASKSELELAGKRIQEAYKGYLERVQLKRPTMQGNDNYALNKVHCYNCSPKTRYPNQFGQDNPAINPVNSPYQQVSCQCCGCLKQSPAAYRDSKGRSILFMENNDLYYNSQPMKNAIYAMRGSQFPRSAETTFEDALPKMLYKLAYDMIGRVLKNTRLDALAGEGEEDEFDEYHKSPRKSSQSVLSNGKRRSKQKSIQKPVRRSVQRSHICDCNNKLDGSQRDEEYTSDHSRRRPNGMTTPPNSMEDIAGAVNLADSDAVVQIALKGICGVSNDERPRIDILGLKLMNNELTNSSEYVCKKRVRLVNRYTQTCGSAGPSECGSSASATSTAPQPGKLSMISSKRASQITDKRQSAQSGTKSGYSGRYSESIRIQELEKQSNLIDEVTKTSSFTLEQQAFVAEANSDEQDNEGNQMEHIPETQEIQEVQEAQVTETHTSPRISENPEALGNPEPSQGRPSAGMNPIHGNLKSSIQKTSFQLEEEKDPEPPLTEVPATDSGKEGERSSSPKSGESKAPDFEISSLKNPPEVIDNKSIPPKEEES